MICIMCKISVHKLHKFLTLSQKCNDIKQKLQCYQRKYKKNLEWQRNNFESCAEKVKETIHRRYCNVKKLLFEACQRHIAETDNMVNVELLKYLRADDHLNQISEILFNHSQSLNFLMKSKNILEKTKRVSTELNLNTPTYVAPKDEFMRFSEEYITLAKDLFGQCSFYTKEISHEKLVDFESSSRRLRRSQSLVELPTYIEPPQKSTSELLSQKSVSSSMSSLPLSFLKTSTHGLAAGDEIEKKDQCVTQVCLPSSIK